MTGLTRLLFTVHILLQPSAGGNKLLKNPDCTHWPGCYRRTGQPLPCSPKHFKAEISPCDSNHMRLCGGGL